MRGKSDETFIEKFFEFLHDETRDARMWERNFAKHPYVITGEKAGYPFQRTHNGDYMELGEDMRRELVGVLVGAQVAKRRRRVLAKLNGLVMCIPLYDAQGKPIFKADGKQMVWRILADATFRPSGRSYELSAWPVINGMEYYCWYALLLVSQLPRGTVKECKLERCGKYFISSLNKRRYCCFEHGVENDGIRARKRMEEIRAQHGL